MPKGILNKASLVMVPEAPIDGTMPSVFPEDRSGDFTFTRGSNLSATRVASNGLIEKGRENLLLQSNQFDTTWYNNDSTETGGQAGYDGTNDAWELSINGAAGRLTQLVNLSGVQTFSVYAKAGTYNFLDLYAIGNVAHNAYFDLATGSVGSTFSLIDSSITSVGNGWYKCSITFSDTTLNVRFYPATADNDLTGTDGSIYIQDAQLEVGLVATDYIESGATTGKAGLLENEPRIDFTGGGCGALLLEPQRTNLSIQSEYITGSGAPLAIQSAGMTISYNQTTSPEGEDNAMKWIEASNNGLHWGGLVLTGTSVGDDLTISIFAKRGTSNDRDIIINVYDGATSDRARYNLDAGTIITDSAASNQAVVSMEDYGNGWWRCIYTRNIANSGYNAVVGLVNGVLPSWQGNGTSNIYTYGLQYEVGSYPTSYIPTYGSAVTRSVDDTATLDLSTLGLNGEDVTYFIEFKNNQDVTRDNGGTSFRFSSNNSNTGSLRVYRSGSSLKQLTVVFQDSNNAFSNPDSYEITSPNPKVAIKRVWATGEIKVFVDGIKVLEGTSTLFNSWNKIDMEGTGSTIEVKQLLAFPTALTDEECSALTQP